MKLDNTLVVGETQQGKTTLVLTEDIQPTILSRSCAVFVLDPHDSLCDRAAQFASVNSCYPLAEARTRRLIVDDLGDTNWVAAFELVARSKAPTPREREMENRATVLHFMDVIAAARPNYKLGEMHGTKAALQTAITAWVFNAKPIPLWMMPLACRPGTEGFRHILEGVTDPITRGELESFPDPVKKQKEWYASAGAAERLLSDTFRELPFLWRTQPNLDLYEVMKRRSVFCLKAGRAQATTVTILFRLLNLAIVRIASDHFHREGKPLPTKFYLDEAASYGLIREPEGIILGTTTKKGVTYTIITQSPRFASEIVDEQVMQNTPRKIWLRSSYPTSKTAVEDLKAMLDPNKEKYRETVTRQRHAGYRIEDRHTKTKRHDGHTETVGEQHVPIYEEVSEERIHYSPLNEQQLENEGVIQGLTRGNCFVNAGGNVFRHQFSDWKEPDIPGYAKKYLARCIEDMKRRGTLTPPTEVDYATWLTPTDTKGNTKAPPVSRSASSAMRRSKG